MEAIIIFSRHTKFKKINGTLKISHLGNMYSFYFLVSCGKSQAERQGLWASCLKVCSIFISACVETAKLLS